MTKKRCQENIEGVDSGKTLKNHLKRTCLHLDDGGTNCFMAKETLIRGSRIIVDMTLTFLRGFLIIHQEIPNQPYGLQLKHNQSLR